jgi:hypothetical protein
VPAEVADGAGTVHDSGTIVTTRVTPVSERSVATRCDGSTRAIHTRRSRASATAATTAPMPAASIIVTAQSTTNTRRQPLSIARRTAARSSNSGPPATSRPLASMTIPPFPVRVMMVIGTSTFLNA